ncbi:MAG: hypothetical protein N3C12_01995 [Candidatus Binatia bacterium]|nr:hypothetical protein [Candidatus Binatia bacterium]
MDRGDNHLKWNAKILPVAGLAALALIDVSRAQAHTGDLLIGSAASNGGVLNVDFDFERHVVGLRYTGFPYLFEATDLGFAPSDTEAPEIYELLLNTEVGLEVLYVSPGVALELRCVPITAPGSYLIGTHDVPGAGSDLHQHAPFRILLSTVPTSLLGEGLVVFRIIEGTSSNGYQPSEPYVLRLSNAFLPELDYSSTSGVDSISLRCQRALSATVPRYYARVSRELRRCFDRVAVWKAKDHVGDPSASSALATAERMCTNLSGSAPDSKTMLGRLEDLER